MFYPPSLLDLNPAPKAAPFYDAPIVRRQPLRALAARVARGTWGRQAQETCPKPSSESSF